MSHKIRAFVNVHNTFKLPENKPDIEFILRAATFPHIEYASTIDKRVIFRGYLDLCIEYAAKTADCSQPVYFACFKLPVSSGVIEYCRIKADRNVQLKVKTKYLKVTAVDCRCIDCVTVVNVMAVQFANYFHNLPSHICLPYFSQPFFSCGPTFCQDITLNECQPDCPPCHLAKPCDTSLDCCEPPSFLSCDCMESDHLPISVTCENTPSTYTCCDCMPCCKPSDNYYQDCCSRNIFIGT